MRSATVHDISLERRLDRYDSGALVSDLPRFRAAVVVACGLLLVLGRGAAPHTGLLVPRRIAAARTLALGDEQRQTPVRAGEAHDRVAAVIVES